MKARKTGRSGISLFLVMAVIGLLLMLLGAFLQLNRQHFSLINSSSRAQAAKRACRSVYEYCHFRLEHDRTWGAAPFGNDSVDADVAPTLQVREINGTHRVEGRIPDLRMDYAVEILNNIEGTATRDNVLPGFARLRIFATDGASSKTQEVMLRTAPLYDASAVASEEIDIQANQLNLQSVDPTRNRIRSKGEVRIPDYRTSLAFEPPANASEHGVVWSQGNQYSGGRDLGDQTVLADASRRTGGRFLANSQIHHEIHDLQRDEVVVPNDQRSIEPGIYVFTSRDVAYTNAEGDRVNTTIRMLERRRHGVVDGQLAPGDVLEFWYSRWSLPADAISDQVDIWTDDAHAHPIYSDRFSIQGDVVQGQFSNAAMYVSSNYDVNVDGDFGLVSNLDDTIPQLVFEDHEIDGRLERGSVSANGSVMIEGNIFGSGKVLAEGDVTLMPNYADISSDEESELAIYSGNNVTFRAPENYWRDSAATLAFRGLIYARENIDVTAVAGQDFFVEGAAVARNGHLHMHGADSVTFRYNPAFLDSIVQRLPGGRVQLERAIWKP